jgi:cellulose synthase/poly-beta-1,6-N-acetylglucosamine synthase-like glycosyltransferase
MSIWGISFTTLELALLGILVVAFLEQLVFYMRYILAAWSNNCREAKNKIRFTSDYLPVSVIISAKNEKENLQKNLPFLLEQDYPANFEIIVVNDGSTDETDLLLSELKQKYRNLKNTFVPDGIKLIVSRKLAVTLGVKAAQHEWLIFTDADCMPEDKYWLQRLARNFLPETDLVFAYRAVFKNKGFLNRMLTYDSLFRQLKLLGYALRRKPITGVACNLALRKSLFIKNKGFKEILTLSEGDLEIVANRYATRRNTRVETSPDSVIWTDAKHSFSEWFYNRERMQFVTQQFRFSSIWRLSVETFFRAAFYLSFIACLVFGNYIAMAAAGLLFVLRFITQSIVINLISKHFSGKRYYFSILLFDIVLPLINAYILIFGKKFKKRF